MLKGLYYLLWKLFNLTFLLSFIFASWSEDSFRTETRLYTLQHEMRRLWENNLHGSLSSQSNVKLGSMEQASSYMQQTRSYMIG